MNAVERAVQIAEARDLLAFAAYKLTKRERDVMERIAEGLNAAECALELGLSNQRVSQLQKAAFRKMLFRLVQADVFSVGEVIG